VDLVRISDFFYIAYSLRMYIFLSAARETVDEGEIAFLHALGRDVEIFLRTIRDIVL
jgi:hypothetical protein